MDYVKLGHDTTRPPGYPFACRAPPGVTSSIDNPSEDREGIVRVAALASLGVAGLFMIMRMYTRAFITRKLGWDDCLAVVSMGFAIVISVETWRWTKLGVGRHCWDIPNTWRVPSRKLEYSYNIIFSLCTVTYKTSILLLYLRLFGDNRPMRRAVFGVMAIVLVYYVVTIALAAFVCNPIAKFWDDTRTGRCLDVRALAGSTCVMNTITDILIFALPWHMVLRLNMSGRRKAELLLVFSTGSFVCVLSALRLQATIHLGQRSGDGYWFGVDPLKWAIVEANVGVTCSCFPATRSFLRQFCPCLFKTTVPSRSAEPPTYPPSTLRRSIKKPQTLTYRDGETCVDGPYIELGKAHEVSTTVTSDGSGSRPGNPYAS